jgi:hypothetical protein
MLRKMRDAKPPHIQEIWPELVLHASVLGIVHYAHAEEVPNLEDAVRRPNALAAALDKNYTDPIPKPIRRRLEALDVDERQYDGSLISLLLGGYLDGENFVAAVERTHDAHRQRQMFAQGRQFIDELHGGFQSRSTDYLPRLKKFLSDPELDLNRFFLAELCEILLSLENSDATRDMVLKVLGGFLRPATVPQRAEALKKFPAILASKLHEVVPYEPQVTRLTIGEVIASLAGAPDGTNPTHYQDLAKFTDIEIRNHLLSLRGRDATFWCQRLVDRLSLIDAAVADPLRKRLLGVFDEIAQADPLFSLQLALFVRPGPYRKNADG